MQLKASLNTNSSQHVQAERDLHYGRGPDCTAILHLCVENLNDTKELFDSFVLPFLRQSTENVF